MQSALSILSIGFFESCSKGISLVKLLATGGPTHPCQPLRVLIIDPPLQERARGAACSGDSSPASLIDQTPIDDDLVFRFSRQEKKTAATCQPQDKVALLLPFARGFVICNIIISEEREKNETTMNDEN